MPTVRRSTSATAFESALVLVAALLVPRTALAEEREACASAAERAQSLGPAGRLIEAQQQLIECSRATCPQVIRTDCIGWLDDTRRKVPTLVVRAHTGNRDVTNVRVFVDDILVRQRLDGLAFAVDPGPRVVRVEGDGYAREELEVLAVQGQKDRIVDVELRPTSSPPSVTNAKPVDEGPPKPSSGIPTTSWILGGAGVVALGSFAFFEVTALNDHADLKDGCGRTSSCAPEEVDSLRTKFVGAGVSLVAAGVFLGAAAIVALVAR